MNNSMKIARREWLAASAVSAAIHLCTPPRAEGATNMYGLIGKLVSVPNRRADVIAILREGTARMSGCLAYVIAEDASDENTIWVTEIWNSQADHDASLGLAAVKDSMSKAKPMIASFSRVAVTNPVAGVPSKE